MEDLLIGEDAAFNNSTPEATAISIARLNDGIDSWSHVTVINAYLTSDGKYWIVKMTEAGDYGGIFTIDAKTLMSKQNDGEWRSLDELKATYIAEIQIYGIGSVGKPQKIAMNGKEIWKIPIYIYNYNENGMQEQNESIYVDLTTGKSKNTWEEFNNAAGTSGWLTLKQVDDTINKMLYPSSPPFQKCFKRSIPGITL